MADFENFDVLFASDRSFAYGEQTITKILKSRRLADSELLIDKLLKTLGVERPQDLYPPRSNQSLRNLHSQIIESASPDHHKQSLLYYILKDTQDHNTSSSTFARAVFLPEKYRIFIDGIWLLDRGDFENALGYLTEPVLIPTFPEEILYLLCTHPDQHDDKLPLAYYYTVSPAVTSPRVTEAFFAKLAMSSVTEALFWCRQHSASNHRKLFEQLIYIVFSGPEGENRARRSVELIHLPFSKEEEAWFGAYLTDGEGKNLHGAKDACKVRTVATGKSNAIAGRADAYGDKSDHLMDWSSLGSSYEQGSMTSAR
ncbi:MAG: hypothetical protein L6R42_010862 [Xanthoria sp. 1 TBL-2021]|nr:MAG: hypothetical protein L6R42_010862 [Xanthoria sp. 1 TBL-2021]